MLLSAGEEKRMLKTGALDNRAKMNVQCSSRRVGKCSAINTAFEAGMRQQALFMGSFSLLDDAI